MDLLLSSGSATSSKAASLQERAADAQPTHRMSSVSITYR